MTFHMRVTVAVEVKRLFGLLIILLIIIGK